MNNKRLHSLTLWLLAAGLAQAAPLGTVFTYQGKLSSGASAATGLYDFRFAIYDAATAGSQVGPTLNQPALPVSNGLFLATLDFGAGVFDGSARWLDIGVRTNGSATFTTLSPRQPLSAAPYASYAPSAGAAATASSVAAGAVTSAALARGAVTADKIAPGAVSQLGAPDGSPLNALQVDTNGWVGIGTNTPQAGLDIAAGPPMLTAVVHAEMVDRDTAVGLFGAWGVAASSNLVAVAARSSQSVSLWDSSNDMLVQHFSMRGENLREVEGVAFGTNNLLAIGAPGADAVTLVDANDPANPITLATLTNGVGWSTLAGASAVAFRSNILAIAAPKANAVTLVNAANPAKPIQIAVMTNHLNGFDYLETPQALAFRNNLLAIAAYSNDAVTLADVSNLSSPKASSVLNAASGFGYVHRPWSLALDGALLAVASSDDNAVTLVDVSNPAAPGLRTVIGNAGGIATVWGPWGMAFLHRNGRTLLAVNSNGDDTLWVFDVTVPTQPFVRGRYQNQLQPSLHFLVRPTGLALTGNGQLVASTWSKYGGSALILLELADQQLSLASAGWVGIGTTVPKAALDVNGDVLVENANRFRVSASEVELGQNARAMGGSATALGTDTLASGEASTAMGFRAQARHDGTFVWADRLGYDFSSTSSNQFLIRAAGGVGINTTTPSSALDVYGTVTATGFTADGPLRLDDHDVYFRPGTDPNHGLGWYGADKLFAGVNVDGPVLYGASGGALATTQGGQHIVLQWTPDGNVGIDKTNPGSALDVNGTVTAMGFTANGPLRLNDNELYFRSDTNIFDGLGWYGGSKDFGGVNLNGPALYGYGGGALGTKGEATRIALQWDAARNVKIAGTLTAAGSIQFGAKSFLNDKDLLLRNNSSHGLGWYGASKLFAGVNVNGPVLYGASGGALAAMNGGPQIVLQWTQDGNVGIGKNDPGTALDVNGTITTTGLNLNGLTYLNDNDLLLRGDRNHGVGWYGIGKPFAGSSLDGPVLYGYAGGGLGTVQTGNTTNLALTWTANGKVGIGTSAPQYPLDVSGTAHLAGDLYVDGYYYCRFGGVYYRLDKSGNSPVWSSSDERLKRDVATIPNALELLGQLRGVTYRWNETGLAHLTHGVENQWKSASGTLEDDQKLWQEKRAEEQARLAKTQTGFIAQEVERAFPDWVQTDTAGYKQVNMEHLNAVLVNAVKEQQSQINALKTANATLAQRLERLERLLQGESK